MILTNIIEIKISNSNILYYKNIFSSIKQGDIIKVNPIQLPHGSHIKIKCKCDTCDTIKNLEYRTYYKNTNQLIDNYFCNKCKNIKSEKTNIKKYGVNNPSKSNIIKNKIKNTFIERYGVDNYSKTKECQEKIKETNIKKYGVESWFQILDNKHDKNHQKLIETVRNKQIVTFNNQCQEIHNNNFDYLTPYIKSDKKISMRCRKCNFNFEQRPKDHIHNKQGCPKCKQSKGEKEIENYLIRNNINYEIQKTFIGCKYKKNLKFDFYLPDYNLCIEYDGLQHYESVKFFGGDEKLKTQLIKDGIKNNFCKENNIKLIRIRHNEDIIKKLNNNL